MGTLFIISGPSGVGKGTLVKLLMKEDDSLALSVSCTTRSPREGERDGVEYFFITKKEFRQRRKEKGFLEWDKHFKHFYGTPKPFVLDMLKTKSVILEIDVAGGEKVCKTLAKSGEPAPVRIMVAPPDPETLVKRLAERNSETEKERKKRLKRVRYELSKSEEYDYVLINDRLEEALERLKEIIDTEKSKKENLI